MRVGCDCTGPSRRAVLVGGVAAVVAASTPASALGVLPASARVLSLRRPGEATITAAFTLDGVRVYRAGYYQLCRALRDPHVDPREGYVQVDPRLIDALWELQRRVDGRVITVLSGYRTPATNEAVGGATASYHLRAMASDFAIDGASPRQVGRLLTAFPSWLVGGIGIYEDDGHVHIDMGPRDGRVWCDHAERSCAP
jgi:uncharacterized protein YcbK (DUF882 family)